MKNYNYVCSTDNCNNKAEYEDVEISKIFKIIGDGEDFKEVREIYSDNSTYYCTKHAKENYII